MATPIYVAKVDAQGNSGSVSSYNTRHSSPLPNRLILAAVRSQKTNTTDPETPTLSGCGVTWTQVATVVAGAGATRQRLTVFRAFSADAVSGLITASFGGVNQAGVCVHVVDCSCTTDSGGSNGSAAVVQNVTNSGNGTTASASLSAFGDTDNATVFFMAKTGTAAVTPGTSFQELAEQNFNSATLYTEWRRDNSTAPDCTWTGSNDWCAVGIEVKAAADLAAPSSLLTSGLAAVTGTATGSAIYVSYLNGNDTTGDGSSGTPYKTLDKALTIAAADSGSSRIIRLKYDGNSPHQPLSGERTIVGQVDGTNQVQGRSISEPLLIETDPADNPNHATKSNMAFFKGELLIGDVSNRVTSNIHVRNLHVEKLSSHESGVGAYGIRVGAARNVEIDHCWVTNNNQGAVLVTGGISLCENVTVHHNWLHSTGSFGASHNANYNHDHAIYWGGQNPGVVGGAIWNNICYDLFFGKGIQIYADGSAQGQSGRSTVVAYNTVYNCGNADGASINGWLMACGGIGASSDGAVNNVITSNLLVENFLGANREAIFWDTTGSGNLFKFNLGFRIENATTFPTHAMVTLSSNIDESDPQFTDAPNQNFRIPSGSPAKGAGESAFKPSDDFYGSGRPTADIGAVAATTSGGEGVSAMTLLGVG